MSLVSPEASLSFPQRAPTPVILAVLDSGDPHSATARSRRPSPTMAAAPLSQPRNRVNTAATMRGGLFKGAALLASVDATDCASAPLAVEAADCAALLV